MNYPVNTPPIKAEAASKLNFFLLTVNDEPLSLFETLEDALKGADEAQTEGAINIYEEHCEIFEFKAGICVSCTGDLF